MEFSLKGTLSALLGNGLQGCIPSDVDRVPRCAQALRTRFPHLSRLELPICIELQPFYKELFMESSDMTQLFNKQLRTLKLNASDTHDPVMLYIEPILPLRNLKSLEIVLQGNTVGLCSQGGYPVQHGLCSMLAL